MNSKPTPLRIAVFGSTTMGTALAHLAATAGHDCTVLTADSTVVDSINQQHCHPLYFQQAPLHPALQASSAVAEHIPMADLVIMASTSLHMRAAAQQVAPFVQPQQSLLSVAKGFEPGTCRLMTQVLREHCPDAQFGTMSGPNMQGYMVQGLPTTLVVAADSATFRADSERAFASARINVKAVADLASYEYLSALKNIVGMAVGVTQGLGLGVNFHAVVLERGLQEVAQLLGAMGLDSRPLYSVAGISDIFLVCTSPFALNYQIAVQTAQGMPLAEALAPMTARGEMAEGVESLQAAMKLAQQYAQPMPLLAVTHALVFGTRPVTNEEFIAAAFGRATTASTVVAG